MKLKTGQLPFTQQLIKAGQKICLSTILFASIPAAVVKAQVVPDGSLPTNVQQLQEIMKINGGERAGNNLFHSFDEFSIPEGMEAVFENALDVENIFTRITGDSISNIDGILRAQGTANLFLVNPNGIVFGENAQLDVGGSFIATTADTIEFENGIEFSASDTKSNPILTIDFPIGLGFGSNTNSGAITVNGNGNKITQNALFVPASIEENASTNNLNANTGQTFALIGGEININSGTITTQGGQIFLAAIESGSIGIIDLNSQFKLNKEKVSSYNNINLSEQTLVNAGGNNSVVQIAGDNVNLANGSVILFQDRGNASSSNLTINADESINLFGTANEGNNSSFIRTETLGSGDGANINITAQDVTLKNGSAIGTSTNARGKAGNLTINANRSLQLLESSGVNPNRQGLVTNVISSSTYGQGSGGDVDIRTSQLKNTDGGTIGASTFGIANGGDLNIKADLIEVTGVRPELFAPSSISAASVSGSGGSGTLNIDTSQLIIADGASMSSASFAGDGGNINITADSVEITGETAGSRSSISASVIKPNEAIRRVFRITSDPTGNAGSVTINSKTFNLNQGAGISVRNLGSGDAGSVTINSEELNLDDNISINATTTSGTGGNINLNAKDLEINNGSEVTATAGNNGEGGNITINANNLIAKKNTQIKTNAQGGNGGNITIDSNTILGIQNSDITANAIGGDGGNITINSDFIVGLKERSRLTPLNDITATSEFGIDGTVTVNAPDTNAEEDVIVSAKEVDFDPYRKLFDGSCLDPNRKGRQELVYVGGGGRPESPYNFFDDDEPQALIDSYPPKFNNLDSNSNNVPPLWQEGDPLIEPNAVQTNPDGRKFLVTVEEREISEPSVCTGNAEDLED